MAWFWLILGGLFEIGFTTALRFVDGFRNVPWTLAFLVSVRSAWACSSLPRGQIPMGTAYAVWGGIGAVGTVMVGMAFFDEPTTTIRLLLILAIVAAIAALRLTGLGLSSGRAGPFVEIRPLTILRSSARRQSLEPLLATKVVSPNAPHSRPAAGQRIRFPGFGADARAGCPRTRSSRASRRTGRRHLCRRRGIRRGDRRRRPARARGGDRRHPAGEPAQ